MKVTSTSTLGTRDQSSFAWFEPVFERAGKKWDEETLSFIRAFLDTHPRSPSLREITHGIGLSSTTLGQFRLRRLKERGLIEWDEGKNRTLRILEPPA